MRDEFNNLDSENLADRNTIDVPSKQSKYISTRKRKELINTESDKEEDIEVTNTKIQIEESKEIENNDFSQKNIKTQYEFNKYNTIEKNIGTNATKTSNNIYFFATKQLPPDFLSCAHKASASLLFAKLPTFKR